MSTDTLPTQIEHASSGEAGDRHIVLSEWDSSDETFELTDSDRRVIREEINDGATRIQVEYDQNGNARFHSRQFVGVIGLPDGPSITITSKAAEGNLLHLLRYSQGVSPTTVSQQVDLTTGSHFIDALAALFKTELDSLIQRGLHKQYRPTSSARDQLRGQINLQRQFQRQGPMPTEFECDYRDQTANTIANQAIAYATSLLMQMVEDSGLQKDLKRQLSTLRRDVELRPVSPHAFDQIEISRLNEYYTDILRLSEPIIRGTYIEDFHAGVQGSYSLLTNMNTVFERAVERGLEAVVDGDPGLDVDPQSRTTNLLDGSPTVNMYPDFVITSRNTGGTRVVGDVKWKTGSVSNDDIYQLTSYMLAHDSPGVLLYPRQDGSIETSYTVDGEETLSITEFGLSGQPEQFRTFVSMFERQIGKII